MTRLEPGQLAVMRVHAAIAALSILAAGAGAEAILTEAAPGFPRGVIVTVLLVILIYPTIFAPGRAYRAWGYRLDREELVIARGIWTQVETVVPLPRVQHIDIARGPIERTFGVCRLVLHTAGTANSRVVLPGLAKPTAEGIRDEVRSRIREDAL